MIRDDRVNGRLVGQWDTTAGTYTELDEQGQPVDRRPFTEQEAALAASWVQAVAGERSMQDARARVVAAAGALAAAQDPATSQVAVRELLLALAQLVASDGGGL